MKKLKLNLDQLSEELEILDFEYLRGVKGGYGDTGGGYGGYEGNYGGYGTEDNPIQLDEVEIDGGYGGYGGGDSGGGWPGWFPPAWPGTGGDTGGDTGGYAPIGGGYGGYGPPTEPTGWQVAEAAANGAIGVNSFYTTLDTWRTSTQPTNIGEVIDNLIETNPLNSMWDDIKGVGKFKGIAVLNTVGHVLGVVGVFESAYNIGEKLANDQNPTAAEWLDLGINIGSMFIKSNAVGMAVSFGWMVIKGDFEETMN